MNIPHVEGIIPHMEKTLLERIDERLEATGLNDTSATKQAGIERSAIRDLRRGKKRSLTLPTLAKLADALGTTVAWLSGGPSGNGNGAAEEAHSPPPAELDLPSDVVLANVGMPARSSMLNDVPVMGTAAGSVIMNVEGFTFEGGQIDTVRRPPALAGAKDLYAIYVSGDSMYPAHLSGDLRFVHPHRPVQVGDTVIIMTRQHDHDPGQAYIKVLARRTAERIIVEQFNPPATLEIPTKYVTSVHRVLNMNDMFGI